MSVTNYQRGTYVRCKKKLEFMGFSEQEAELLCSEKMFGDTETFDSEHIRSVLKIARDYITDEEYPWDECVSDQMDEGKSKESAKKICGYIKSKYGDAEGKERLTEIISKLDSEASDNCVSRKISIMSDEHPEWSHDKVVAAAHGWCRKHGDSIRKDAGGKSKVVKAGELERISNISLRKFVGTIRNIKTEKSMKVGHMGILPFRTFLPMKSLNKLQTKLEKLLTAEQKFLTHEQLAQRSRYIGLMKKEDSKPSVGDLIDDFCTAVVKEHPKIEKDQVFTALMNKMEDNRDNYFINSTSEMRKINDKLNNIIKAPVVLAREMVQKYKGGAEKHFKPYEELKKSVQGVDKLPIVIEHQDNISQRNRVGYVKEIRADPDLRAIKGTVYLTEGKLPDTVVKKLDGNVVVPVSIGFFSKLGDGGEWEGQHYDYTQEKIILDHLAVCVDTVARCPTGYCGIGLDSKDENENHEFTFKSKDNYYINICELLSDSKEKKEDKQEKTKLNDDNMKKDSEFVPKDLKAFMHWIKRFVNFDDEGDATPEPKNARVKRILNAFKNDSKEGESPEEQDTGPDEYSDSQMDKEELEQKDSKIKELQDSLAGKMEDLSEAEERIKELEEEKRQNLLDKIDRFAGNKFEDGELEDKKVDELEIIYDSVSRFEPSNEKPSVIPVEGKENKEDMEDSLGNRRFDPRELHKDVNKDFNLERFGVEPENGDTV